MKFKAIIWIWFTIAFFTSAHAQIKRNALPHVLVYRTRGNYNNLVPVTLSDDKRTIISYPDPQDVKTGSGYPLPVHLHKGYLLDKRGIGKNTAFLDITYGQYAQLKHPPATGQMYRMIKDKNPITGLCDCGNRTEAINKQYLNSLIDRNSLRMKCRIIK